MGETIIEKIIRHNTGKAVKPGDIELVDEMGSALDYYMNSLTINGNKATANQVSYDETKHVLKIIIPDEKKVVLEYEATINLPVGEDSSALNKCLQ